MWPVVDWVPVSEMQERASSSTSESVSIESVGKGMTLVSVSSASLLVPMAEALVGERATVADALGLGPLSENWGLFCRLRAPRKDDERGRW